jgi:hypothetical protein
MSDAAYWKGQAERWQSEFDSIVKARDHILAELRELEASQCSCADLIAGYIKVGKCIESSCTVHKYEVLEFYLQLEADLKEYRRLQQGCPTCVKGDGPKQRLIDEDGCSVTDKPKHLGHAWDDYHWFCADAGAIAENDILRRRPDLSYATLQTIAKYVGMIEQPLEEIEVRVVAKLQSEGILRRAIEEFQRKSDDADEIWDELADESAEWVVSICKLFDNAMEQTKYG